MSSRGERSQIPGAADEASRAPIPYARQDIDESDIDAVVAALRSDFVTQGPRVGRFEAALQELTGARYAVAVSSGTAALHLSCQALDLSSGDIGLVPAITFAATANCLRYVGAGVAFCDVDATTGKSGVAHFEEALARSEGGSAARAFLPVSFTGSVSDLEAIAALASQEGTYVIEDAAHSIGAQYRSDTGKLHSSGSCDHSDAAILSFHPVKHICAGEGGAVLTNDETLARRVRRLRSHGIDRGENWLYNQVELGCHYRMTELQAALGASQLKRLDQFVSRRRQIARRYREAFAEEPFRSRLRLAHDDAGSSWHLMVVHFGGEEERLAAYRYLHSRKIHAQVHYLPVYRHDYYKDDGRRALEGAERFYSSCLSLPLYPTLSDEEQEFVIEALRQFFAR